MQMHLCPNCGKPMTKVKGTKGTYECKKCGTRLNPSKKLRLGDMMKGAR